MFILKLYDRKGVELQIGDIVAISDGKRFYFWAQVTFLEKENAIAPFHTFSFHSFEKVDRVPDGAVASTEERYKIWYKYEEDAAEDNEAYNFGHYLADWQDCERQLNKGAYKIDLIKEKQLKLL